MIATVTKAFRHDNTGVTWQPGQAFGGTESQARELERLGFVRIEVEPEPDMAPAGAPPALAGLYPLEDMTATELRSLCAELGLHVTSKTTKPEMAEAIEQAWAGGGTADGAGEPA